MLHVIGPANIVLFTSAFILAIAVAVLLSIAVKPSLYILRCPRDMITFAILFIDLIHFDFFDGMMFSSPTNALIKLTRIILQHHSACRFFIIIFVME